MQGAIVLAFALTGLGCQNKGCDLNNPQPAYGSFGATYTYTYTNPSYTTPYFSSGYYLRSYSDIGWDPYPTHWASLRSTLFSLVLGHDPDVATAREIEASVYGDSTGH